MFEAAELGRTLDKQAYKKAIPDLRLHLLEVQRAARAADVPVVIIVAGVAGAGKGEVVNRLFEWLDSRGVEVHAYWDETDEEKQRPRWWRYWRTLPAAGGISILFGAWYTPPILEPVSVQSGDDVNDSTQAMELTRIADTERMLVRAGVLVVKFWCHLPEKEQARRIKRLRKNPHSHWRMAPETARYAKHYKDFVRISSHVVRGTDTGEAPWYLIEATDPRYRDLTIGRTLLSAMQARLGVSATEEVLKTSHAPSLPEAATAQLSVLDHVDLQLCLARDDYKRELAHWQGEVNRLAWAAFHARRSYVVMFEGWDAAGKGGAIRRLIQSIDARLYRVVAVAAPSDEERAHHYLWRFWRHLPRDGYGTLFDRSWYGRVLVERVEGFARPAQWAHAYHEINDFEEQLSQHGTALMKFWLHIDQDEQLRRFQQREQTPYKEHKIGEEDWRNRARWDDYKAAINEMVVRTSTEYAPWHLIPANDKLYARIAVLKVFALTLKDMLDT